MMINWFKNDQQKRMRQDSSIQFLKHFQSLEQIHRVETDLTVADKSDATYFSSNKWLFGWKLKYQVLLLTVMLITIVAGTLIVINQLHLKIFASLLANGFTQILLRQNENFQSSVMLKYMSLTRIYFYNDQQLLLAINQINNYALKSEYSVDKGNECPISRADGKYPSYWNIDLFCYAPQGSPDLQTFKNSSKNTEFVKFTNILNQFILTFSFPLSYKINNYIQINFDNKEEMVSVYPQGTALKGYSPRQRPFFTFQKQQYNANVVKEFYVSQYFKWFSIKGGTLYGQTLTLSLLNRTQFQGVIALTIQFNVFDQIFKSFPDINIALVANDGTVLYKQTQFQIYNQQQYIYNQSSIGYNYLDWLNLSSHTDYSKQVIMNNTLFPEPIKVNIKKFKDLPYYFIVYNNLTYENQIKTLQIHILDQIHTEYLTSLSIFMIIVLIILLICYFPIDLLMKPIILIQKLIHCRGDNFKQLNELNKEQQSDNILYILLLTIYLKYSELENLSFKKNVQCQEIEDRQYSFKQNLNSQIIILKYLRSCDKQIQNHLQPLVRFEGISQLKSE